MNTKCAKHGSEHPDFLCPDKVCGLCYKPYLVKNPHPDAGKPSMLLEVGAEYECIPCNQKALHGWSQRALKAESANAALEQEIERLRGLPPDPSWMFVEHRFRFEQ